MKTARIDIRLSPEVKKKIVELVSESPEYETVTEFFETVIFERLQQAGKWPPPQNMQKNQAA